VAPVLRVMATKLLDREQRWGEFAQTPKRGSPQATPLVLLDSFSLALRERLPDEEKDSAQGQENETHEAE